MFQELWATMHYQSEIIFGRNFLSIEISVRYSSIEKSSVVTETNIVLNIQIRPSELVHISKSSIPTRDKS